VSDIEDECGVTYEHKPSPGSSECRECGADLSSWLDDEDDFEGEG